MKNQNFTIRFSVDESPKEVFDAINNVRGADELEVQRRDKCAQHASQAQQ